MIKLRFGVLYSVARVCRHLSFISFLCFVATAPAVTLVNSWIKPTSGAWQELPSWSLGELPDPTQDVLITNANWKAVEINAQTAQNFSDSMTVHSVRVSAPPDSFNTLLMNFAGFGRPLQTGGINIETNGALAVQSSWLEVIINSGNGSVGNVSVSGTVKQGDFSWVTAQGSLTVSTFFGPGAYFFTNGILRVDMDERIGGPWPGKLVQYGGTNTSGSLTVSMQGELDVHGGQLTATNGILVGLGDFARLANFYQFGGNVNADTSINGNYFLSGGTIRGNMSVVSPNEFQRVDASVSQSGGTNSATSLDLAHPNRFGGRAFYTLSNGVINVDTSTTFRGGLFSQYAGRHTIVSNLNLHAADLGGFGFAHADYALWGGTLSAGGLSILASTFQQSGGSNSIAGNIVLTGPYPQGFNVQSPQYNLTAGFLTATNVFVSPFFGGFRQSGGIVQITGTLALQSTNFGGYQFSLEGGTLMVKDIVVSSNAFFQHTNGTIVQSGLLTLNQGGWRAANGDRSLGPLLLTGGSATNSVIDFPGGASILRLANSSAQPWSPTATLIITDWQGSVTGGGATQFYFGNNASGLTAQQLSQIKFAVGGGLSSAKILATGEIVPSAPLLTFGRTGNTLTLTWGPGFTLQSATNVVGPYLDVPGATSPYQVSATLPRQFFRLRQ